MTNLTKIVFFGTFFVRLKNNERFAHSLLFTERCERIAQVAYQKWAMWANRSGCSPKMSDHERFAQVAHQKSLVFWANRSFAHSLRKPMSEFPALTVISKMLICWSNKKWDPHQIVLDPPHCFGEQQLLTIRTVSENSSYLYCPRCNGGNTVVPAKCGVFSANLLLMYSYIALRMCICINTEQLCKIVAYWIIATNAVQK